MRRCEAWLDFENSRFYCVKDDWHDIKCVVGSLMIASGADERVRCQWYGMAERVDLRNGARAGKRKRKEID